MSKLPLVGLNYLLGDMVGLPILDLVKLKFLSLSYNLLINLREFIIISY